LLLKTAWAERQGDFEVYRHLLVELAEAGRRTEVEGLLQSFPPTERNSKRGFSLVIHVWHYLEDYARVIELWESAPLLQAEVSPVILRDIAYAKALLGDTEDIKSTTSPISKFCKAT
jgi:hypothetical protein